jgi:hypothetical protein
MLRYSENTRKIINGVGVLGQTFAVTPGNSSISQYATGSLTSNTRFVVPHGLGYPPALWAVNARMIAVDDDSTAVAGLAVDKCDGTNVTLKPSASVTAANVNFLLIIDLEVDDGGRLFAR